MHRTNVLSPVIYWLHREFSIKRIGLRGPALNDLPAMITSLEFFFILHCRTEYAI